MAMRNRREKGKSRRVSAQRRLREHKSGGDRLCYNAPAGLNRLQVGKQASTLELDFLCYKVGKHNPFADPGEQHYEMTYFCHPRIGPTQKNVLCNAKTFESVKRYKGDRRCFVCEYRSKLWAKNPTKGTNEYKLAASLNPKERQAFLVINREDRKKGVQLFDYSFHCFGKYLDNKINTAKGEKKSERDGFADPKQGCTLTLTGVEKPAGDSGGTYIDFPDIEFTPRKKPIDSDTVSNALKINLDEMILNAAADYDEVKELFLQGSEKDDDEEDDDDNDEDEEDSNEDDEDEEEEVDGEDDEDDDSEDEDDDEDDGDEDDELDSEDDDDEDSDDDSSDDEEDGDTPPCAKGDLILAKRKGNKLKGKVIKVLEDKEKVKLDHDGDSVVVSYDDVVRVLKPAKGTKKKKSRNRDF